MVDSLLWQLVHKPLPPSPVALGCLKPIASQLSGEAVNIGKCFFEGYSGLQDKGPGPVVGWRGGLRGQAYDGGVPTNPPLLQPSSCRPCQHVGTHAAPRDSRSQCVPQLSVKTRKRSRSTMPVAAHCGSELRSCSLSSSSAPNFFTTPWQTSVPRGFSFPSAPRSSEDVGSPSAVYALATTQVMLLARTVQEV